MIIAFTGYRPNKLNNDYDGVSPLVLKVKERIKETLIKLNPDYAISGMALGVDQWAAEICIVLGIPLRVYIPFEGQEKAWPAKAQIRYQNILSMVEESRIVCGGGYAAYKMQIRNEAMVNSCDMLLAVINKNETSGGTFNCVSYAKGINKEIIFIHPESC
jgi:uncharacterized phage-like protein YoqJ